MEHRESSSGFTIDCLDHVAIRVRDMEKSKKWYEKVLGLKTYQFEAWGDIPIFLLAGTTGIALFPADASREIPPSESKHVKIDHFAFRVSREAFEQAKIHYQNTGIDYHFQDHTYFHSIYTKDPDGHTVELTTLTVEPEDFYQDL